jgi:hypothetical protein
MQSVTALICTLFRMFAKCQVRNFNNFDLTLAAKGIFAMETSVQNFHERMISRVIVRLLCWHIESCEVVLQFNN